MTVVKLHHLTTGHLSFHLLPPPPSHVFHFSFFFPTPYATLSPSSKFCSLFSLPTPALFLVPPLIISQGTKGTATDSWTILGSHGTPTLALPHSLTRTVSSNSKIGPLSFHAQAHEGSSHKAWRGLTGCEKSERATQASALIRDQVSSAAPGRSGTGKLHSVPPPEELVELVWQNTEPRSDRWRGLTEDMTNRCRVPNIVLSTLPFSYHYPDSSMLSRPYKV